MRAALKASAVLLRSSGMSQRTMDAHVAQTDPAAVPASEFWTGRRALVTGGCGFIGSHLVEMLLSLGVEVVVLDAYNSTSSVGFLSAVDDPALEVRLGDVADPFLVRELSAGVDTVFHLAA